MVKMEIEDIRRIEFRPGDKLVVRIDGRCTQEQGDRLRDAFEAFAPGVPVLVLDKGISLDVLSEHAE